MQKKIPVIPKKALPKWLERTLLRQQRLENRISELQKSGQHFDAYELHKNKERKFQRFKDILNTI